MAVRAKLVDQELERDQRRSQQDGKAAEVEGGLTCARRQ